MPCLVLKYKAQTHCRILKDMDESPYTPPESDLQQNNGLPNQYNNKNLSSRKLFIAACLSLLTIVIEVVDYVLHMISLAPGSPYQSESIISSLLLVGIGIYLTWVFREFLRLRFNDSKIGKYLLIIILLSIFSVFLILSYSSDELTENKTIAWITIIYCVVAGVLMTLVGINLLKLPNYPGIKFYAWSSIVAGICYATLILFYIGVIVGILANIPFALILFTASAEVDRNNRQ